MFGSLSFDDIKATQHVKRWHMIKTRRSQNLAEHSFMVALIAGRLASKLPSPLTMEEERDMLRLALLHDIAEIETGDIPTPTKRRMEALGLGKAIDIMETAFWTSRGSNSTPSWTLADRVNKLVRLADLIESAMFYMEEGFEPEIKRRICGDALFFAEEHFPDCPLLLNMVKEIL